MYSSFLGLNDIFSSIHTWPEEYVFILHTHQIWYPNNCLSIPKEYLGRKIFFNNEPVPFDQLEVIYSSCDIGVMVHEAKHSFFKKNLYYSDLSIGKMFQHLKVGVPLIARRLPGYEELIEGNQVGVCMDEPSDILPSIIAILNNYQSYSLNAVKLHNKLRFELHHDKLIEKINSIVGSI